MDFFRSTWLFWVIVPIVIAVVVLRRRMAGQQVDAGSTLSPGQDNGSWDMTAALPMCPVCESPMVLRNTRRRSQQAWECATPGCKGADQ